MEPIQQTSVYHFPVICRDPELCIMGRRTIPLQRADVVEASVIESINSKTTPAEFDAKRQCKPTYKLQQSFYGMDALKKAMLEKNLNLFRHIIKLDRNLVNLADSYGVTVLTSTDPNYDYEIAKISIFNNANVNLAAMETLNNGKVKYVTALWEAAEYSRKKYDIIFLLLFNGGIIHHPLSEKGQKNVDDAIQHFFNQTKVWTLLPDENSPFKVLPKEIIMLIFQYYV